MKMQAHGVIPVTSTTGALAETVRHGVKVAGDISDPLVQKRWFDEVVKLAQNPWTQEQRNEMALAARQDFSWSAVAEQWISLFTAGEEHRSQKRILTECST